MSTSMIANNLNPLHPTHPGCILKEELESRGISQRQLAKDMGISYSQLNEVLNEKRAISPELSLMFEAALGIDAEPLMNMQTRYNLQMTRRNNSFLEKLKSIHRVAVVL